MKARSISAALAIATALLSVAKVTSAQEIGGVTSAGEPQLGARDGLGAVRPYWESGKTRWFVAGTIDFGAVNYRSELDLGYGKPHFRWVGLELTPQISLSGTQTGASLRFVVPGISLRTGARYFASADRRLLEERDMYTREQINLDIGPRSRYFALDAELQFDLPLPFGVLSTLAAAEWLDGVPEPFNVFHQQLRIVVDPPLAWRARSVYLFPAGRFDTLQLGGILEFVGVPKRDEVMVRVGPAVTVSLTHHLDAIAAAALSVRSKDDIGLQSADFGQISFRYRWALGDRWPEFP